ncbi:hypothetical protein AVEN_121743-1 [Araneus ventricosus]|uniref:Uncharacterized protein n=1 Tax=Araneus ventricosus TaxID=182803 RepID=A0A4Y2UEP1_ARAVE|nr:hypothetical protein AVEN_121743-1 [Araneus ventricosus]
MCKTSKDQSCQACLTPMRVNGTSSIQPGPRTKLFSSLKKKHLGGWHFRTDAEVQQAILACLNDLDADFSSAGFDKFVYL